MALVESGLTSRDQEDLLRREFRRLRLAGELELRNGDRYSALKEFELAGKRLAQADSKQEESNLEFSKAIEKTQRLYNVEVVQPAGGHIVAGPLAGAQAAFSPKFLDKAYEFRAVKGTDGKTHYFGANFKPDVMGVTWPDGETVILPKLFEVVRQEKDPGILAALLYHEAVHFNELVTRRWDTLQGGEVRAYDAELAKAATFSLSALQKQKAAQERAANQAVLDSGDVKKIFQAYPVPDQEEWAKRQFDTHETEQAQLKSDIRRFRSELEQERMRNSTPLLDPRVDLTDLARSICAKPSDAKQADVDSIMDALINFCQRDSCAMALDSSCQGVLIKAMLQEAQRGHRVSLDWLKAQAPVEWIPRQTMVIPGCYKTCRALARVANAACDDPESVSQSELDRILDNDDGMPYERNIAILPCPARLLEAMMRAKRGGRSISADWLKDQARQIAPKDYRYEEKLRALAEKACRYGINYDDAADLNNLRGDPVREAPDAPSDPCAAALYQELLRVDRSENPENVESLANQSVRAWRANNRAMPRDEGNGRTGERDNTGADHSVPNRHWNPTFHPN